MKTARLEGDQRRVGGRVSPLEALPDEDEVVEMANLSSARTGVDGVIFISTRMGSHVPPVKYFLRPGRSQPCFSVSIENDPQLVANSLPQPVVSRMAPSVVAWVKLNRAALLDFWEHGDTWLEQVTAFKAGLQLTG